jgi:DUF1680 family protein
MNRRKFVKVAALAPLAFGSAPMSLASPPDAPDAGQSNRHLLPTGSQRERFELTLNRVLHGDSPAYTDQFILADVRPIAERRFTEYSGDISGRYIGALASSARIFAIEAPGLDALVDEVIVSQKPDGYFGSAFHYDKPTDTDMALLWGNGRLLVGLLEYYQLRQAKPVLAACARIGDFLVRVGPLMLSKEIRDAFGAQHFASSYICWTQQTEGLARLYRATKDGRYRKLAEDTAAVIERRPGDHVHGYLTSLRGVVALYEETEDPRLLRQCEEAWRDIDESRDLLITGGVPEGWSPNNHRTEGCAEADWVRLNLVLGKATGNRKYLAMAERAIFNEFAFNQYETGDFGHRVYTETGLPAGGAVRAWWCCTLHGLRCFPAIQESVFRSTEDGLRYELPLDGRIEANPLAAVAESDLAKDGRVRITVRATGNGPSTIEIRKPEWADTVKIQLNGAQCEFREANQILSLNRAWVEGDVIELKYELKLKSTPRGEKRVVFSFGPWLLGASDGDNFSYFNELTTQNKLLGGGEPTSETRVKKSAAFSVPVAATSFPCAQAEYPDQPAKVELRAIAEQTGQPTASWELCFLTEKEG